MSAMSLSVETIIADAHKLVLRLKEHDTTANRLVSRTQSLQMQLGAMKQFQDYLSESNGIAKHRPRIGLIITLAQENSKIRELQQENKDLRESLDEHQSALELIMCKYREQVSKLQKANSVERCLLQQSIDQSEDLDEKSSKISEMAAIMNRAVHIDSKSSSEENRELIKRLEFENRMIRQLLQIEVDDESAGRDIAALVSRKVAKNSVDVITQTDDDEIAHSSSDEVVKQTLDSPSMVDSTDENSFCGTLCSTVLRGPRASASDSPRLGSEGSEVGETPGDSVERDTCAATPGSTVDSCPSLPVEVESPKSSPEDSASEAQCSAATEDSSSGAGTWKSGEKELDVDVVKKADSKSADDGDISKKRQSNATDEVQNHVTTERTSSSTSSESSLRDSCNCSDDKEAGDLITSEVENKQDSSYHVTDAADESAARCDISSEQHASDESTPSTKSSPDSSLLNVTGDCTMSEILLDLSSDCTMSESSAIS